MKQWILASWLIALMVVGMTMDAAAPKTRTDLLVPREELGPDALVEVVTWARNLVAAGKRGDADAARALLEAAPASIAPLVVPEGPIPDEGPTIVIVPIGEESDPSQPVEPAADDVVTDDVPAGALVGVMSWCDEMLAAARAGDMVACEEIVARSPVTLPVVVGEKSNGVSMLTASLAGGGCAVVGIVIGVVIMALRRK